MTEALVENFENYLLVRFSHKKSLKDWWDGTLTSEQIALNYLDANSQECSVYKFDTVADKTKIIAAHFTSLNRDRVEKVASIEISGSQIKEAGLIIKKTEGKTGIAFVDIKHHDMCGDLQSFKKLVEILVEFYNQGNQPFQPYEPEQLRKFIIEYSEYDGTQIKDFALKRCVKALSKI